VSPFFIPVLVETESKEADYAVTGECSHHGLVGRIIILKEKRGLPGALIFLLLFLLRKKVQRPGITPCIYNLCT